MTKKHFIKIAATIKDLADMTSKYKMANNSDDYFKEINPNFDSVIWYKACGL